MFLNLKITKNENNPLREELSSIPLSAELRVELVPREVSSRAFPPLLAFFSLQPVWKIGKRKHGYVWGKQSRAYSILSRKMGTKVSQTEDIAPWLSV